MVDVAMDQPPGDRAAGVSAISATSFGRYTLVAKLGQGAMAEVFLALRSGQAGFQKLVVIKRMHAHLLAERGVREMFLDEARLAALLSHPNVVQTNEVAEVDGIPFMALEYLDGQPISNVIMRCKAVGMPLPPPLVARVVADALDGLQHAHDLQDLHGNPLNVVHRDVSPHNLFISYDGVTKVLDFGVAKASLHAAHTEIGTIKGKYAYLSPEQAEQEEALDGRSDVWGMGVVLWESLTGRRLFKRDTEVATLKAVLEDEIPKASRYAVDAPPELCAIADKALQRDRDQRYPSAQAMKEDLERFLATLDEPARRRDVGRFLRDIFEADIRERRAVISACLKGEVGENTEAFVFSDGTHPSYSSTHGAAPKRRSPWIAVLLALVVLLSMGLVGAILWPILMTGGSGDQEATTSEPSASDPVESPAETPDQAELEEPTNEEAAEATAENEALAENEEQPSEAEEAEAAEAEEEEAVEEGEDRTASEDARAAQLAAARRRARARARARAAQAQETRPAEATGRLYLDTNPWASVYLGSRSLGDTPLSGVELPAGRHVLTLRNPDRGIEQRYTVVIEPGEITRRRVGLR